MQKWEYCFLYFDQYSTFNKGLYLLDSTGKKNKMKECTKIEEVLLYLNNLGKEGWEVVTEIGSPDESYSKSWTLKRPLQND